MSSLSRLKVVVRINTHQTKIIFFFSICMDNIAASFTMASASAKVERMTRITQAQIPSVYPHFLLALCKGGFFNYQLKKFLKYFDAMYLLQKMARAPANQLTCLVCKTIRKLPENVKSLPTNVFVTNIVRGNKIVDVKDIRTFDEKNKFLEEKISNK